MIGPVWEYVSILESLWLKSLGIFLNTLSHMATSVATREGQLVKSHERPNEEKGYITRRRGKEYKTAKPTDVHHHPGAGGSS